MRSCASRGPRAPMVGIVTAAVPDGPRAARVAGARSAGGAGRGGAGRRRLLRVRGSDLDGRGGHRGRRTGRRLDVRLGARTRSTVAARPAATRQRTAATYIETCMPSTNACDAAVAASGPAAWPMSSVWPPTTRSWAACPWPGSAAAALELSQLSTATFAVIEPRTAMPIAPPTCREALITPDAMPARVRSTADMASADVDGMVSARPAPSSTKNGQICVVRRADVHLGQAEQGDRGREHADQHHRPRADAGVQPAGDGRDDQDHQRRRQRADAGLERRVALDVLEVQGDEVDRAEEREADEADHERGDGEGAACEEAQRQHRLRRAQLPHHEGHQQREPRRRAGRGSPATARSGCWSGSGRRRARRGRRSPAPCRRCRASSARGSRDSATRQSSTTAATTPIGTLIQKTLDQPTCSTRKPPSSGPSGEAEAGDAGPDADRRGEPLARERGDEDGERERVHDRGADALERARGDQLACRWWRARRAPTRR